MADGYGVDIYCWDRLVPGRLVRGPELVAQAIYRRLTTPRGTLRDGDEGDVYGLDLLDFIGRVGNRDVVDALPSVIAAEVSKDDRVANVDCKVTPTYDTDGMVSLAIELAVDLESEGDDFTLTLGVSDSGVAFRGFA